MDSWPISARRLRAMYAGGRANATARRLARMWAAVFSLGLVPRRWVTLDVTGRTSGRTTRFALGMARLNGSWYLVPMLGEQCNWVRNVRAAGGQVTLRHGRAIRCQLTELPVSERPPVLREYLRQVPGARPHVPVDRHASVADFAAIAPRYPVFLVTPATDAARSRRRGWRRWWRWAAAGIAAVVIIAVGADAAFVAFGASAPPLRLPTGPVSPPAGSLAGDWHATGGSQAGFRVRERALGLSSYVGGRTTAVSGTVRISADTITAARFQLNLTTVTVSGKTQPQFAASLGTSAHPVATIALSSPVTLSPAFVAGRTVTTTATGTLTIDGATHPVVVTLTARRDGPYLQAAGSIPVTFARWGIRQPGRLRCLRVAGRPRRRRVPCAAAPGLTSSLRAAAGLASVQRRLARRRA